MSDGFKVICLKCGKEYIINNVDKLKELVYNTGYDGQLGIGCEDCGNMIEDKSN